jgi:hypothetical protein
MDRRNDAEALPIVAPVGCQKPGEVNEAIGAWRFDRFTFDGHRSALWRKDDGKPNRLLATDQPTRNATRARRGASAISCSTLIGSVLPVRWSPSVRLSSATAARSVIR